MDVPHIAYLAVRHRIVVMINSYFFVSNKTEELHSQGLDLMDCWCHFTDVKIEDHRMVHEWSRTDVIQPVSLGGKLYAKALWRNHKGRKLKFKQLVMVRTGSDTK